MIIPKDQYEVTEDIVTVLAMDISGQFSAYKVYGGTTLDKIQKDCEIRVGDLVMITVIAENPLNGRIMRYGNHNTWELMGILRGYA